VARDRRRGCAAPGKQGRGREAAGECPYRTAVLLWRLFNGGEQQSGGAVSSRSTTAMAAAETSALGFRGRRRRLRLGDEELVYGLLK
jgi:hypothetical protein